MASITVSVENLSKMYRLGAIGTGTFFRDFRRWWEMSRGRPDPYQKIDDDFPPDYFTQTVWALKDISFDLNQGDALGIIGRNGAGKSTLLKILSRITAPTSGIVKAKGRISSILEVGTGFHSELTGRENIFLNGALMGMNRSEVKGKLDEIIDFSGVERYIDTPVKRYSSGMYVRLAFAVAAHLEPDILIVDEVLAVGDIDFQKRSLGKMNEAASEGRTVLFVSHNMVAVQDLCSSAIWIDKGKIIQEGKATSVVASYLSEHSTGITEQNWEDAANAPGNQNLRLLHASVKSISKKENGLFAIDAPLQLNFQLLNNNANFPLSINVHLHTNEGIFVFNAAAEPKVWGEGILEVGCTIPSDILNNKFYAVSLFAHHRGKKGVGVQRLLSFEMRDSGRKNSGWYGAWEGVTRPNVDWKLDLKKK